MPAALYDNLNLLSKLTLKKVLNTARLTLSYTLSRWTGKDLHSGMPDSISIEPTTSCNLRCPECPSGLRSFTRPTGMLELALFKKVIDETKDNLIYMTLYFQGEPYLNEHFSDMVRYASSNKIYTATSTNAHYLTDSNAEKTVRSGLDRLIISIDGTTQETYQQYRIGGSLHKVIEGTKNIIRWKKQLSSKTPQVIFQFLVVKPNEHQTEEVKKLARELGVDKVRFKTAQIYDYKQGSPLIPDNDKYSRYKKNADDTYQIKNDLQNNCWKMWHSCVITWDGKLLPCCFDKDAQHEMGNVSKFAFRDVWQGAALRDFRKALIRSRSQIEICKNCTEGTKVWA